MMGFCGPLEGGGMKDLLSYCLLCMSALIPHPLYCVYEKFITGKLSWHDWDNSLLSAQSLGREEGDLTGQIPYNSMLLHMFMV
jgi:hypothetical protein